METENSIIKIEPNIYLKVLLIKDYIITSLVDAMIVLSIFSMNFSKQKKHTNNSNYNNIKLNYCSNSSLGVL